MALLTKKGFGKTSDGRETWLYTLTNKNGMSASVTDYGAALVNLFVPDKDGRMQDVVLGYENGAGYEAGEASFGATVGRNANRIAKASFRLMGVTCILEKNDHENNLHSGRDYYNKRIWEAEEKDDAVTFVLHSPDGDQGFPGTLAIRVTYRLTEDNALVIRYYGVPDKDTLINMTNHSYFNLNGHDSGDILNHELCIDADYYTRTDENSIPTGEFTEVSATPMDFRTPTHIGASINGSYEAIRLGHGYDHNFVLKNDGKFVKVAKAAGDDSGIFMEIWTDLPGLQVYTANYLNQEPGKMGAVYGARAAVCFETQYFPDAIHHDNFKSPVCKAGKAYETATQYRFGIQRKEKKAV